MAMGRRAEQQQAQEEFWIAHTQWPRTVAHLFYQRLNQLLEERGFDEFVEGSVSASTRRRWGVLR